MLRCIETIAYTNGMMPLLFRHAERFRHTQLALWKKVWYPDLEGIIKAKALEFHFVPDQKYKCRIVYGEDYVDTQFFEYQQKQINCLVPKEGGLIQYDYKYENRDFLNVLKGDLVQNAEILILKDGLLTDTSFTNIALQRHGKWFTPRVPLLSGVQRAALLDQKIIFEKDINVKDLCTFDKIKLFNAMVSWQEAWELPIDYVRLDS